ncbi:hypothetical protein AVEN_254962-1 [Araneus ventricosus]|uniref:Uncharacterized protein n=1 Tax=Araneus ventricosus TaxID=182803 RepID=A0A4Y2U0H4_ARAVE|nr:hypothetical protein AVEN_254962-1 [Araneus ventricosus]
MRRSPHYRDTTRHRRWALRGTIPSLCLTSLPLGRSSWSCDQGRETPLTYPAASHPHVCGAAICGIKISALMIPSLYPPGKEPEPQIWGRETAVPYNPLIPKAIEIKGPQNTGTSELLYQR